MPIQPNFLERTAFFTLNAAPAPMLDLAGAVGAARPAVSRRPRCYLVAGGCAAALLPALAAWSGPFSGWVEQCGR